MVGFLAYEQFNEWHLRPGKLVDIYQAELRRLSVLFDGISDHGMVCAIVWGYQTRLNIFFTLWSHFDLDRGLIHQPAVDPHASSYEKWSHRRGYGSCSTVNNTEWNEEASYRGSMWSYIMASLQRSQSFCERLHNRRWKQDITKATGWAIYPAIYWETHQE